MAIGTGAVAEGVSFGNSAFIIFLILILLIFGMGFS